MNNYLYKNQKVVSELIMKEKLQKCSSSTSSESSEDASPVNPKSHIKKESTVLVNEVRANNETNTSHDSSRYLQLKLPSTSSKEKSEVAKSTPSSPESSSSRVHPSTSSASSSSMASESPSGSDFKNYKSYVP